MLCELRAAMTKLFPHAIYQHGSMTTTCSMFTCVFHLAVIERQPIQ